MTDFKLIKVAEGGRLARLTLARPPLNVVNIAMLGEINTYLESLIGREDLCALLINGEGKTFSAGVDVHEHKKDMVDDMIGTFHRAFRLMHQLPMPTVCAVHGSVFGGAMELAIFADIILASDDMKIGVPEIKLGVFPPLAMAHLAQIVGIKKAAELMFMGAALSADEALRAGVVNHVYPAAEFAASTEAFLKKLTSLSAFSLRKSKDAYRQVVMADFERALSVSERIYLKDLMNGHDPMEGLTAFTEKRKPEWKDQ